MWGMNLPQFNPHANLSDSLYANRSAVYIARYDGIEALHDQTLNNAKSATVSSGNNNAIDARFIDRRMVKLFDAAAVEEFGDFSIDPPKKGDHGGWVFSSIKPAFGARIYKPDGRVIDIDMEKAVTVTSGKKDKNVDEYKIAIEGLEPGDVLDYFYYTEVFLDEQSMPGRTLTVMRGYPTLDYMADITVSSDFAFEYMNYNGAPDFVKALRANPCKLSLHLTGIDAIEEAPPYFSSARQIPAIRYFILNNTGRLQYVSKKARNGGVRKIVYPMFIGEVAQTIIDSKLPAKLVDNAANITRNWIKAHPQASQTDIYDAAWLALRYTVFRDDESMSERQMSKAFVRLLEKIGAPDTARVAIGANHYTVPIKDMINPRDPRYMATVAGRYYVPVVSYLRSPGVIPAEYDGETIAIFDADPEDPSLHNAVRFVTLPQSKAKDNKCIEQLNISLNPANDENLLITTTLTFEGNSRITPRALSAKVDEIHEIEDFLGVMESKRVSKMDATSQHSDAREAAEKLFRIIWGSDEATLDSYAFTTRGVRPDDKAVVLTAAGSTDGAVNIAGRDLVVNIGRFIGKQTEFSPSERTRTISIIRDAETFRTEITFSVPDGYTPTPESVEALKRNINTGVASFFVDSAIEGSTVKITVLERYTKSVLPASDWSKILAIADATVDFQKANIVLKPL